MLNYKTYIFILVTSLTFSVEQVFAQAVGQNYLACGANSFANADVQQSHELIAQRRAGDFNFLQEAQSAFGLHHWETDPYDIDFDYARILNALWLLKNSGSGPHIGDGFEYAAQRIHKMRPKCDIHFSCSNDDNACWYFGYVHDGGLDYDKEYRTQIRRGYVFEASPLELASTVIHESQHKHTSTSDVALGSSHPGWAARGPYAKEFLWLAWFAANGNPSGFSAAEVIEMREEAANLANDVNNERSLGQSVVTANTNLTWSPINLDSFWSVPFPQSDVITNSHLPFHLGDASYFHEGWGMEAECIAPDNHFVTGLGGRMSNGNIITTLHLNVRELRGDGSLGPVTRIRCGTAPDHNLELFIDLPNGYVMTGIGGRVYENNFSGFTAYARQWDANSGGLSNTQLKFIQGSSLIEMEYQNAPAQNALVGVGFNSYNNNIRGLTVYMREANAPAPTPPPPSSVPSGSACQWDVFTGNGGPGWSVHVARNVGPCVHSTREEYYSHSSGQTTLDRTVYY